MKNITIREVTQRDIDQLQAIGKQTFTEAFAADNSAEYMSAYLERAFSLERLTVEIADKDSEFHFALHGESPIGYLKINTGNAQTEIKANDGLEIERIYVLKEYYGKQAGQLLLSTAIEVARQKQVKYVWLGVSEENPRAIRFYEKNGFVKFDEHIFNLAGDEQVDIMMKLEMKD